MSRYQVVGVQVIGSTEKQSVIDNWGAFRDAVDSAEAVNESDLYDRVIVVHGPGDGSGRVASDSRRNRRRP